MDTVSKPRRQRRATRAAGTLLAATEARESAERAAVSADETIESMFHDTGGSGGVRPDRPEFIAPGDGPEDDDEPQITRSKDLSGEIPDRGEPAAGVRRMTMLEVSRNPDLFRPSDTIDDERDEISRAIGAKWWLDRSRMEWCKTYDGRSYVFWREYRNERVLVDMFANDNRTVRREYMEKVKGITAYNAAHPERPFGYLAAIRGATIPFEVIERAKEHQICALVGGAPIEIVA